MLLGTAVGVLPGIGPAMTVALLLPITYVLDPTAAFIMFAGIYYGGMYGGSTTSILLNTPGESSSIMTALEGNKMAKAGRGAAALGTAAHRLLRGRHHRRPCCWPWSPPPVVELAIMLGPEDYFALAVLAFLAVAAVLGSSPLRGLAALCLGLFLGLVGTDLLSGQQRFTFGIPQLADGIDVVIVAVALFAVGEALHVASRLRHGPVEVMSSRGRFLTRADLARSWKPWLRGTAYGFPFGALPAGGAEIPTFLSYATEKRLTKHPEEFGAGAIEGVAGPEAANNAAAAGVLVPLLTLGLPTSATAAILLAAFQGYGIQPGPTLLTTESTLVWALIASLFIGNVMLLVLNLPLVGIWVKLLRIPRPYLYAGILLFASLGAYAVNADPLDLVLLLIIGLLGFVDAPLRLAGGPGGDRADPRAGGRDQPAPGHRHRRGQPGRCWSQSPFSVVVYVAALLAVVLPPLLRRRPWPAGRPSGGERRMSAVVVSYMPQPGGPGRAGPRHRRGPAARRPAGRGQRDPG